ncbi:putative aminoacyltransferase, E1 ubiquitin-activating enzyme [Rosa chinensis]|uniref:RING-type E3 ubiquitin transferase n=1 Tax=Rosa chinensis TaxID=74649 RepID=A0A2P6P399_ROSCH|nr:E3 ubiquitin ligase BIG BROTHER-related [Rosa chinensis]PRQ16408.1 putative aminoacyltransferase, E1 ubiquitin-activating enzyme [Rosa chinensis]
MAEVTYLQIHDLEENPAFESLPYWSSNDFDLYISSDPDFPPAQFVTVHEEDDEDFDGEDDIFSQYHSTIHAERSRDDVVSEPNSISNTDDLSSDRENQVNFVMDLFQQRVEQSQVTARSVLVSGDSDFGVVEGNCNMDDGLDLDLSLGLGLDFRNCFDDPDEDDFFVGRRVSGSESGEATSSVGRVEPFESCVRLVGFGSESDEDENGVIGLDLHSEDEYGEDHVHGDYDDETGVPLCWDSLRLEEQRESNEEFEWEEVDGRVEEVFGMLVDPDNEEESGSVSVSLSAMAAPEEELRVERVEALGNLEWEVLLNSRNWEPNQELDHDAEHFPGDHDDYIYTAEYDMLFGQFSENENAVMGRPPAANSVVETLPSVVVTQEDVENGNALCAVCKDDITLGEQGKKLPCAHRYHGDCIVPWLRIRNTCPVCRYELRTDDAAYERRRSQGTAHGLNFGQR